MIDTTTLFHPFLYVSYIIETLKTFLVRPSPILKKLHQQRHSIKPGRPNIILSSIDEREDIELVGWKLDKQPSSYHQLIGAVLRNIVKYDELPFLPCLFFIGTGCIFLQRDSLIKMKYVSRCSIN